MIEVTLSPENFIGHPVTFGKLKRIWTVREVIRVSDDINSPLEKRRVSIILTAPCKRFISETEKRMLMFTGEEISGDHDDKILYVYLNKKRTVKIYVPLPPEIICFAA